MKNSFEKLLKGYSQFRKKYALGDESIMNYLAHHGQKPETMVVSCCDSRVDPALILQCDPGDLFVVRNVANIIPPYEKDKMHHGTSAALEFGICFLQIKHLILLGHSHCGGIEALLSKKLNHCNSQDDFITNWVSLVKLSSNNHYQSDEVAKIALNQSYQNCLTFPWIKKRLDDHKLIIHVWFFDIQSGQIYMFDQKKNEYQSLTT